MKMKISRLIRNAGVLCIGLMSLPVSTSASSDIVSNFQRKTGCGKDQQGPADYSGAAA